MTDSPVPPEPTRPLQLSIVIPVYNEQATVQQIVRRVVEAPLPAWMIREIVCVNDHSTDGTGELARAVAVRDPRVRVVESPPLPPGWFGKQWACATGARAAGVVPAQERRRVPAGA